MKLIVATRKNKICVGAGQRENSPIFYLNNYWWLICFVIKNVHFRICGAIFRRVRKGAAI